MRFNIIPPGMDRPYTFGHQLRQQINEINDSAQSLRLSGLQQQFLIFKGLGSIGSKRMESISKQADQIARRSLSPLEYSQSRGSRNSGFRTFFIDA